MMTLRLPDVTLAYQEAGHGLPAVYVHGGFASLATTLWDEAEAGWSWEHDLSARFRFITYDRRGCGASSLADTGYGLRTQADDLAALLDHLSVPSAHIIGSSAGGPIAITFAARRPERVRSLVLVGTALDLFPHGEPGSDAVRAHLAILHREGPEAAFAQRPPEVEVTFGELWDHTEAAARGELEMYLAQQERRRERARAVPPARRVAYYAAELDSMCAYIDADLAGVARRITAPALVLQGSHDQLVPLPWAEELARTIPGAQLHVVPGGSHSLMIRDASARRFVMDWMLAVDAAEGGS